MNDNNAADAGQPTSYPLVDKRRCQVSESEITISAARGAVERRVSASDITAVSRGGKEVMLTRRAADPVVLEAASIDDARRLEAALSALVPGAVHHRRRNWLREG
jgi:hypothetical protein